MLRQLQPLVRYRRTGPSGAGGHKLGPFLEWARNRAQQDTT